MAMVTPRLHSEAATEMPLVAISPHAARACRDFRVDAHRARHVERAACSARLARGWRVGNEYPHGVGTKGSPARQDADARPMPPDRRGPSAPFRDRGGDR